MLTHELITNARRRSRLSLENFAALTNIDPARLAEIEASQAAPTTRELDDVARALGVELQAFMQGDDGPSMLFFRSMRHEVALNNLLLGDDGLVLGDFLRCVGRVSRLRGLLADPLPEPSWLEGITPTPLDTSEPPFEQGVRLAAQARTFFGLGDAPIPSMRDFLSAQGVEVFFLTPGRLQAHIDGACTLQPAPAILINPLYQEAPWSQRSTMAHELCHLIHDRGALESTHGLFLVSPASEARRGAKASRWSLFDKYLPIEQRANAFAAHFLAPSQSVRSALSGAGFSPASGQAAQLVSTSFGVSYETAVNILWRAYNLKDITRTELLNLPRDNTSIFAYAERPACGSGLFTGQLCELALRAYKDGKLTPVGVRRLLEIPMDAPLPQGYEVSLTPEQRAPVLTQDQRVRKHAARLLMDYNPPRHLYPAALLETPEGWKVEVMEETDQGERREAGAIFLTHDGVLIRPELSS